MKTNKYIILLLALSTLLFQSCLKDQEDIFDKPSSLRMQEVLDKTKAALTGNENGWSLDYFPDRNLSYGGIAYAIQFKGSTATVFSQESDKSESSLYKLTNDDGPVLSFDTYNSLMHAYATPSKYEYEAKDGDFEFIIMDVQDDVITLKGKRSGNIMHMHRLSKPAKDYIDDVKSMEEKMRSNKYTIMIDDTSVATSRTKHVLMFTDPKTGKSTNIPFVTSSTGFEFYEPVTISDRTVSAFTYSEDGIWKSPEDRSVALMGTPQSLSELLISENWFFKASAISPEALNFFNMAKNGSEGEGEIVNYLILGPNSILDYSGAFGISFISGGYGGSLIIDAETLDETTVSLFFTMQGEGDGIWYFHNANYSYLISVLTGVRGYTYTLTADNPKNPTWIKMEQLENPDIYFTVFKEQIATPFEQ